MGQTSVFIYEHEMQCTSLKHKCCRAKIIFFKYEELKWSIWCEDPLIKKKKSLVQCVLLYKEMSSEYLAEPASSGGFVTLGAYLCSKTQQSLL